LGVGTSGISDRSGETCQSTLKFESSMVSIVDRFGRAGKASILARGGNCREKWIPKET